jgi:hypothetical protein
MDGDVAPLVEMCSLCEKFGAELIVDEAHSTGCFGPKVGLISLASCCCCAWHSVWVGGWCSLFLPLFFKNPPSLLPSLCLESYQPCVYVWCFFGGGGGVGSICK